VVLAVGFIRDQEGEHMRVPGAVFIQDPGEDCTLVLEEDCILDQVGVSILDQVGVYTLGQAEVFIVVPAVGFILDQVVDYTLGPVQNLTVITGRLEKCSLNIYLNTA